MNQQMDGARSEMKSRTMGSDSYDGSQGQGQVQGQSSGAMDRMKQSGESMMNNRRSAGEAARDRVKTEAGQTDGEVRTMGSDRYDGVNDSANRARMQGESAMEDRTKTPTSTGTGVKAESEANY